METINHKIWCYETAIEAGTNMIIVVNDNDMSIAENHGGSDIWGRFAWRTTIELQVFVFIL